jgi:hypothetical protein
MSAHRERETAVAIDGHGGVVRCTDGAEGETKAAGAACAWETTR